MEESSYIDLDVEFSTEFQEGILALMHRDVKFLAYASENLKPDFFSTKELAWLFFTFKMAFSSSSNKPTERLIKDRLRQDIKSKKVSEDKIGALRDLYRKISTDVMPDAGYIQGRVIAFVFRKTMQEAFVTAREVFNRGDYVKLASVFQEAHNKADFKFKPGHYYLDLDAYDERIARRERSVRTIPTCIDDLDVYLKWGGLGDGELGLILGPPSRGKSMALKHIAQANMLRGRNVVYFTLEMKEDSCFDRMDMSMADFTVTEIVDYPDEVRVALEKAKKSKSIGDIHIKEYPSKRVDIFTLKAYTDDLRRNGFTPDFVVIDYLDLLNFTTNYKDKRENLTELMYLARGWAQEDCFPLWSGAQGNRGSLSKTVVTIEDLAEDFGKAFVADVIIALCQTDQERVDQVMRLFGAKNRDSPSGFIVKIFTDFAHGRLVAKG